MPAAKKTATPTPVASKTGVVRFAKKPAAPKPAPAGTPTSVLLQEIRVRGEQITSDIKDLLHRLG